MADTMVNAKELRAEADKAWEHYDNVVAMNSSKEAMPKGIAMRMDGAFKAAGRASRRAWKAEKEAKQ